MGAEVGEEVEASGGVVPEDWLTGTETEVEIEVEVEPQAEEERKERIEG